MKRKMMGGAAVATALLWSGGAGAAAGAPMDAAQAAAAFGARPSVEDTALSPDGKHLVFVEPAAGKANVAAVMDLSNGATKPITYADGNPLKLTSCNWSANDRIVCSLYGISVSDAQRVPWTRLVGVDSDGKHQLGLGRHVQADEALGLNQYDGGVIDWMTGDDGKVLVEREITPQQTTGTIIHTGDGGLDVERVDTRSDQGQMVEAPNREAVSYVSDGSGVIRIMVLEEQRDNHMLTGNTVYRYRTPDGRAWRTFSSVGENGPGLRPLAVDGTQDVAYALDKKDGRDALYRVSLDGSMKSELVYANPQVDVDGIVTVGRRGRVIGLTYTTDQRHVQYFDPEYAKLSSGIAAGLPKLPGIDFVSTSADEQTALVLASSETDPGRYYLLDRAKHTMVEVMPVRPQLVGVPMGEVKAITYRAKDGTTIPAYLTLPPGSDGKNLPALVMPHGGPAARDEGGFDFLAQFFAQRGYAVIQPEYRGSTGYGDTFFNKNGFQSWHTAISDVNDAGRWLVAQGIADPKELGIFGWSYGGYAALQSNVLDPALFKAVVAVAPVTDFDMIKSEFSGFTNYDLVQKQLGDGSVAREGSPDRHADLFQAPVLMFHGDQDRNVDIAESRAMEAALHHAGKQVRLVVYPGLDHQLDDSRARADMLAQSDAFLRKAMHISG